MLGAMNDFFTRAGARTPEELEALFEDALVLRDGPALAEMFEAGAVFLAGAARPARGGAAIARQALATWAGPRSYVAHPQLVLQARDLALLVAAQGINVMRRGRDGAWRYVIVQQAMGGDYQKEMAMTQNVVPAQTLKPAVVAQAGGEARWWYGSLAVIKASAADTGGQLTIIEITEPPGAVLPLHVHHREDEGFWLLEGDATFEVGGNTTEAHAGDYVFGPRDIPHGYSVGPAGCRMLFLLTPGGFEDMVRAMSQPALSRTLPPPSDDDSDWAQIAAIAKPYGIEFPLQGKGEGG